MTDFEVVGEVAPEYDVIEPNKPTTSQILGGVWQQPGLGTIQAVGGMARAAGDLTGFRTLQDWGAEVARNAKATRQDLMPLGMDFVDQAFTGALGSVGQMLPWMFAGGPVPGIVAAGVQSSAETYSGYRDYGFSGGRSAFHAGINGLAEAAGEKISLPVLWNGAPKGFAKQAIEFLTKDMVGEQLTTFVQGLNSKFSNEPEKTVQSFLDDALMTAAVVPMAAGMQLGVARGAQAIMPGREELPVQELVPQPGPVVPPEVPPVVPPTVPPVAPPATPEVASPPTPEVVPPVDEQPSAESPIWMPDSRSAPPNEQLEGGRIDLRLYENGNIKVQIADGMIKTGYQSVSGWHAQEFQNYDDAYAHLMEVTGLDLKERPDLLNQQWTDSIMKALMLQEPGASADFSGSTLQYIEGLGLKPVMQSLLRAKSLFGTPLVEEGKAYRNYELQQDTEKWSTFNPATKRKAGIKDFMESTDTVRVASKLRKDATALKAAKRVEGWAKAFGLSTKFIIDVLPEGQPHIGELEANVVDGVAKIYLSKNHDDTEITLAHEFGHALAFDTLLKADPMVQLKVMRDWAVGLQSMGSKPGLTALVAANGVNRIDSETRYSGGVAKLNRIDDASVMPEYAATYTKDVQYQSSFQEHLADRVAQYMFDNKMIFTPEEQSLYQQIADILQNFYKTVVQKFVPNTTFEEYLNTLRANAALARDPDLNETPELPKPDLAQQPGQEKKADKPQVVEHNGYDPARKDYWDKQRNKANAALKKAVDEDTFDAIQEEIDPTGLSENYNFDRAYELLEMQGVPLTEVLSKTVSKATRKLSLDELLETYGEQVDSTMDAMKRMGEGDRVFAVPEMDETPFEIKDVATLAGYTTDQLIVLSRFVKDQSVPLHSRTVGGGRVTFPGATSLIDDTYPIRAQSLKLQEAFPDLKRDFTKSREATKRFGGFLRKMLTAVQIRKRYGAEVPPIEQGVNAIERMEAYKARARTRADDRVKQMKAVGKDQRNKVFKFMMDEDKTGRWMSESVPNTLDGSRKLSPEIARKYGITEEGGLLYAALRKDFYDVLKELESLAMASMARNVNRDDPLSVAQYQRNVQALQEQTAEQLARPYVPHTRFGDFYVQVSSETGKVEEFYQFESKGDAQKWAAKLRDEGKNASAGVLREDIKTFAGLPPSLIQSMKGSLDLTEEQMRAFEDILKNMSGGQSFVRKMKKRKDIPGWADDEQIFPRVYADYMTKYANHAGRLKFSEELKQSEISLKQMIRDEGTSGRDTTNLGALLNWLQETNRYAMNPTSEWANIRGAVTLWYLGFSVKSAAVNALSVPMVTYPYLAQRFSDVQAVAAISRAYKDLSMKFHKPGVLTDDELKFMEDMRQQNILDESYSSELAGIREGGTLADTMDITPQGAVSIAKYYGMWMFHKMEGVNRQATALAAYRLARTETTFDPLALDAFDTKAAEFAKKTVQDTQNVNAQWNRSEFMRGGKSVLTMFMSYQQNIIFQMFGGDASWMRLLAVQLLVAGMMGLPFAKDADNLIKWFSRKVFDTDASAEKAIREWLSGFMNDPSWVLHGGSYNVFGSNLQGSLGMGQVIPGLDALAMEGSFPERMANAAPDIGGPAAAVALNFMQAMSSNDPDLINRFNRTLPAFAKQMSQGWTMFNEGVAKNSMGDPIADASRKDAVMKMLGFQSTEVSKESAKRFAQKDTARFWLTERQYVLQMYYMASKPGNAELASKAREALYEYNRQVPNASLRIGAQEVLEGIKSRTGSDEKDARGAPRNARDYQLYKEISRRY